MCMYETVFQKRNYHKPEKRVIKPERTGVIHVNSVNEAHIAK